MAALTVEAARAAPWAPPGDIQLRHDLQLLSDYGLLVVPLTTWPVTYADIALNLRPPTGVAAHRSPAVRSSYTRVRRRLRREARFGFADPAVAVAGAHRPARLRTFADIPRDEGEFAMQVNWMSRRLAWQLQATAAADPHDDATVRLDGSYLAAALGNWMVSVGALPRWWGPGWDGSLILGTAARPVPAVVVERNDSRRFELPVLRWLGPWKLVAFLGQLESDRQVPEAKLFGMRVTIKPTAKLELGLSRTAQWGGEGRPEDFDSFGDLVTGKDNRGDDGITVDNEPGNQLAGIDLRWQSPLLGRLPYAIYAQYIGEDEAGGAPSRHIGLVGLEQWGSIGRWSYRLYLEAADTAANFYDHEPSYNTAYEHDIYRDGYRYRGRPLGHALDNDSRLYSLGLVLVDDGGALWSLNLQQAELNRDGTDRADGGHTLAPGARTDMQRIFLTHRRGLFGGQAEFGLGAERRETDQTNDTEPQGYLRWSANWN